MSVHAHVTVGSYGHILYGYDVEIGGSEAPKLVPRYSYEAHVGSVTSVAIAGEILVSGGADEVVKVYDLKKRVERGNLMEHEATITALAFYGTSHLLSASEDGAIHVWDTSRWETLKVLHGHKGAVDSLSIHPSGKLALSVGRDYTLHVWNLIKGRKAYVSKIQGVSRQVMWVGTGASYAVVVNSEVLIYATDTGDLVRTLVLPAPIHSIAFYDSGNRMVAGVNSDTLYIVNTASGDVIHAESDAHEARVRNVAAFDRQGSGKEAVIFTSSSDGNVKVWEVTEDEDGTSIDCDCVAKVHNGGRLTCMAVRYTQTASSQAEIVSDEDASTGTPSVKTQTGTTKKSKSKAKAKAKAKPNARLASQVDAATEQQANNTTNVGSPANTADTPSAKKKKQKSKKSGKKTNLKP
eukprot:m.176264 g.176264  ORF g.176264 m.176264 type:complete len:408 (+) comp14135_c0_seq1:169-1392(+)